jgi:LysR family glycine cleavage system transcriptional activator
MVHPESCNEVERRVRPHDEERVSQRYQGPAVRLLRQINLNSLKVLESAARHQNFTRAGEEQLITPSAVSQQVKALEEQLRFKIFERRRNAVSLTPQGEVFVREVRGALDRIATAAARARHDARSESRR